MKNNILLLLSATLLLLTSCTSPYGERVTINESIEIYIKGDNVTTDEARNLGNYLADLWKDAPNKKSLQLFKEGEAYTVKMVVDEEKVNADPTLKDAFEAIRILIEQNVFEGKKVTFAITDNRFKTIRSFEDTPANSPAD